jgi:hypothetical protein
MKLHGVPLAMPLLRLTIPLQVGAGLALIANWHVRTAAFLLAGLLLLAARRPGERRDANTP